MFNEVSYILCDAIPCAEYTGDSQWETHSTVGADYWLVSLGPRQVAISLFQRSDIDPVILPWGSRTMRTVEQLRAASVKAVTEWRESFDMQADVS